MKEIIIRETEAGQRLDKFLNRCLPEAGKSFLYKMLRKKNIVLNGKKAEGKELLKCGDSLKFFFSEETMRKFSAAPAGEYPVLDQKYVLYEDEDVLIVNKTAGMLSQKAEQSDVSLAEYLTGYLLKEGAVTSEGLRVFQPGVCNRLDRNTSGIVLSGKHLAAARELSLMLKQRTMKKYYLCLVQGTVQETRRIAGYLRKNPKTNKVTVSDLPAEHASYIETCYEPAAWYEEGTLLKVELITGRTHQIRSHLAYTGHPIAGDVKYGNRKYNQRFEKAYGLRRQFLHAWQVVFPEMEGIFKNLSSKTITAPLPDQLERLLEQLHRQESLHEKS